jgi:hypothetical protein
MAQKAFNSSVTGKPTLTGVFQFDPDTGLATQYNCGCCSGICTPNNISWSPATKFKQFSITCGGTTFTFSGTYTPVPNGRDFFANGVCSFPKPSKDEEDWTATARGGGDDLVETYKKRKPTKKSKPSKKAKPAKQAKASKKAKPAKKADRKAKSVKSAKSAKKR